MYPLAAHDSSHKEREGERDRLPDFIPAALLDNPKTRDKDWCDRC